MPAAAACIERALERTVQLLLKSRPINDVDFRAGVAVELKVGQCIVNYRHDGLPGLRVGRFEQTRDGGRIGHVRLDRQDTVAEFVSQRVSQRFALTIIHHDARTFVHQCTRDRGAESAGAARYQHPLLG
jgi:hypothetical protein